MRQLEEERSVSAAPVWSGNEFIAADCQVGLSCSLLGIE
jgi:hypothetical protein